MVQVIPKAEMHSIAGRDLGCSDWLLIDQERINVFAEATNDHQFIHVDTERAKHTPAGTTIAHGFLSLSLLSFLTAGLGAVPEGHTMTAYSKRGRRPPRRRLQEDRNQRGFGTAL